jgi:hypothetical protein
MIPHYPTQNRRRHFTSSFGKEAFEDEDEVMEAFIAEASLVIG